MLQKMYYENTTYRSLTSVILCESAMISMEVNGEFYTQKTDPGAKNISK